MSRRQLRATLEQRSLAFNREFLEAADAVNQVLLLSTDMQREQYKTGFATYDCTQFWLHREQCCFIGRQGILSVDTWRA